MRELNTIQKVEKLNTVYAMDEPSVGGANHRYAVQWDATYPDELPEGSNSLLIQFQQGPRKDITSLPGVLDTDLLEIVRDRMRGFQSGEFATDDNAKALEHIELALMYLNKRVMDRYERGVLGTNQE